MTNQLLDMLSPVRQPSIAQPTFTDHLCLNTILLDRFYSTEIMLTPSSHNSTTYTYTIYINMPPTDEHRIYTREETSLYAGFTRFTVVKLQKISCVRLNDVNVFCTPSRSSSNSNQINQLRHGRTAQKRTQSSPSLIPVGQFRVCSVSEQDPQQKKQDTGSCLRVRSHYVRFDELLIR